MKRKVLAIAIPALLASGLAQAAEVYNKDSNKIDLYGKVDARHIFSDDSSNNGDKTYARLGFKGETQITTDITGYGQWEYNIEANKSEKSASQSWTRLAFAGLKIGDAGSFDYGRNYGVLYDIEAWTDMLPVFGGDTYTNTDNYMTGRANGLATYRNNDFFGLVDGLNFALQYQGKNEGANEGQQEGTVNRGAGGSKWDNGDGWGISSTWNSDFGLSVGAAYAGSDRTQAQTNGAYGKGDKAEAWTVGTKFDDGKVYLAAMYAETRNMTPFGNTGGFANKTQNVEVVAQYQFDFGLRPSIAYLQSKGKDLGPYSDGDLVKYVDIGATYYFNKNFATYVDYKINLLDNDGTAYKGLGISTDDVVGVGMVYQF